MVMMMMMMMMPLVFGFDLFLLESGRPHSSPPAGPAKEDQERKEQLKCDDHAMTNVLSVGQTKTDPVGQRIQQDPRLDRPLVASSTCGFREALPLVVDSNFIVAHADRQHDENSLSHRELPSVLRPLFLDI